MLKFNKKPLLILTTASAALLSTGCALSPQIIALDTQGDLQSSQYVSGRTALVRVLDQRSVTDNIGNRGGRTPESSPLIVQPSLQAALTQKMQSSLQSLGFGGASPIAPIKVEVVVNQFNYRCNEGNWVSECGIDIELTLNIDNEGKKFSQPFSLNENRSVAIAPQTEYNTLWINQSVDKLWQHIFTQPQVKFALGVQ